MIETEWPFLLCSFQHNMSGGILPTKSVKSTTDGGYYTSNKPHKTSGLIVEEHSLMPTPTLVTHHMTQAPLQQQHYHSHHQSSSHAHHHQQGQSSVGTGSVGGSNHHHHQPPRQPIQSAADDSSSHFPQHHHHAKANVVDHGNDNDAGHQSQQHYHRGLSHGGGSGLALNGKDWRPQRRRRKDDEGGGGGMTGGVSYRSNNATQAIPSPSYHSSKISPTSPNSTSSGRGNGGGGNSTVATIPVVADPASSQQQAVAGAPVAASLSGLGGGGSNSIANSSSNTVAGHSSNANNGTNSNSNSHQRVAAVQFDLIASAFPPLPGSVVVDTAGSSSLCVSGSGIVGGSMATAKASKDYSDSNTGKVNSNRGGSDLEASALKSVGASESNAHQSTASGQPQAASHPVASSQQSAWGDSLADVVRGTAKTVKIKTENRSTPSPPLTAAPLSTTTTGSGKVFWHLCPCVLPVLNRSLVQFLRFLLRSE